MLVNGSWRKSLCVLIGGLFLASAKCSTTHHGRQTTSPTQSTQREVLSDAQQSSESFDPGLFIPDAGTQLPIRLLRGIPLVEVGLVDGSQVWCSVDTGSSVPAFDFRTAGLSEGGEEIQAGTSGTQSFAVRMGEIRSIQLGEARYQGLPVAIADLEPLRLATGFPLYCILGVSMWENVVVEIDYPKSEMRIRAGTLQKSESLPMVLSPSGVPRLKIKFPHQTVMALLDTGSTGSLELSAKEGKGLPLVQTARLTGRASTIGNEQIDVRHARVQGDVILGQFRFQRPMLEVGGAEPRIGSRLLRDFRITLDFDRRRYSLARDAGLVVPAPPPMKSSGFGVQRNRAGDWTISYLLPWAKDSGIQEGDKLLAIDGQDARPLDAGQIKKNLHILDRVSLTLERKGNRLSIAVPIRVVVP